MMETSVRTAAASLRVFLDHIIDYAGLFAPASLDMKTSVNNYSSYLKHSQRCVLGRFVLPVSRLDEFLNTKRTVSPDVWQISGILSPNNIESELALVGEFNRHLSGDQIDVLEARIGSFEEMDQVRQNQPPGTTVFYEVPLQQADEFLPILRHIGACAKLRTGGVTAEAIPAIEHVTAFIGRCAELGLPFKATAGLHHPVRCNRPLTHDLNSSESAMHGFLNVFTATAIAWAASHTGKAVPRLVLETCLADRDRTNWHFGDDALTWSGDDEPIRIDVGSLRLMRSKFALSFGSCSFEEPLVELHEFDLL